MDKTESGLLKLSQLIHPSTANRYSIAFVQTCKALSKIVANDILIFLPPTLKKIGFVYPFLILFITLYLMIMVSQKIFEQGLWYLIDYWGWGVDRLISFWKIDPFDYTPFKLCWGWVGMGYTVFKLSISMSIHLSIMFCPGGGIY